MRGVYRKTSSKSGVVRVLLLVAGLTAELFAGAQSHGGSNVNWYGLPRDNWGVIGRYHLDTVTVDQVFQNMANNHQERVRLGVYHRRGGSIPSESLVLDSTDGDFDPTYNNNIRNILASLASKNFSEVVVAFHPQAKNLPIPCQFLGGCSPQDDIWNGPSTAWNSDNDDYFEENWNLIYNIYCYTNNPNNGSYQPCPSNSPPPLNNSQFVIRYDLGNELAPNKDTGCSEYVSGHCGDMLYHKKWGKTSLYIKKMWVNFNLNFGKANTVGFSIPDPGGSGGLRIRALYNIYAGTIYGNPYILDVHLYDNASHTKVYNDYIYTDTTLRALFDYYTGLIIGEAY